MKTPFSTVLIVFRLTPIAAASSACVQPRASRASRSVLRSSGIVAALERGEAHHGRHHAGADEQVDRLARGEVADADRRVDDDGGQGGGDKTPVHGADAI